MNDGLEKLGAEETIDGKQYGGGVFVESAIESIRLPPTLKRLGPGTFSDCKNLKRIEIPHGIECIRSSCFYDSGVEEIMLPATLREISKSTFTDCRKLKTVWVEEGCAVDVKQYVGDKVEVRPKQTRVSDSTKSRQ